MPEALPKYTTQENKNESEVKHWQIKELEEPLRAILENFIEPIKKGEYDLIIGIDASGRIPTLIIDKFIRHIYDKNGIKLETRFLAGSRHGALVEEQIERWNPQRKVLIVEDTIASGTSITGLTGILRDKNIHFDIIAVGGPSNLNDIADRLGADRAASGMNNTPSIYSKRHLAGVHKLPGSVFSSPRKAGSLFSDESQQNTNEARADVKIVADHLIHWYESRQEHEE